MALLKGKIVVTCPKRGAEVEVHKDCVDCPSLNFISLQGRKVLVSCGKDE